MGLESATYINDLNTSNPVAGDNVSQGDDHIRLVKNVLKATFPNLARAVYLEQAAEDLASASSPDLSTPTSNYINITGTTQINGFASEPAGFMRLIRFAGALTLNYNGTSFILPGGDDIVTVAGDHAVVVSLGSGDWRMPWYSRASGRALTETDPIPTITTADVAKFLQATDDSPKTTAWGYPVPPGSIVAWPLEDLPTGWLHCNGQAVSRTTYSVLFALLGVKYGAGDSSTTFNLPDYRGRFLRGWDDGAGVDPDAAERTNRGDTTTGDEVGTKQADAFKLHGHTFRRNSGSGGTFDDTGDGGVVMRSSAGTRVNDDPYTGTPDDDGGHQLGGEGGDETRPKNVGVVFIMKY